MRQVERETLEVGMAVVPRDELGRSPRAGEILAGNSEAAIALRADGVEHGVVQRGELLVADVPTDLDVPEEAEARPCRDLLEGPRDGLELRMVGRHAEPHEAPRRRQALDHVDLDERVLAGEQRSGGVERCRPGAHDRNTKVRHRRACYG
jgi:hypothetical protein